MIYPERKEIIQEARTDLGKYFCEIVTEEMCFYMRSQSEEVLFSELYLYN